MRYRIGKREGPKYPPGLEHTPPAVLSPKDQKALARLVKARARLVLKYGADAVADAEKAIVPRPRGRPSRGDEPYFERMHLADWLDEVADEHRQAGNPAPKKQALFDLFQMTIKKEERLVDGRFDRFAKTTKKKWPQGRRELQLVKEQAQRRDEWMQTQKRKGGE